MLDNAVATLPRQDVVVDLLRFLQRSWGTTADSRSHFRRTGDPQLAGARSTARATSPTWIPINSSLTYPSDAIWRGKPPIAARFGALALESAMTVPQSSLRIVRCNFDVTKAGNIAVKLNTTDGLRVWLDGVAVDPEQLDSMNVESGTRVLTFMVDLDQRDDKTLRCEILPAAKSPAAVRP